MWGRLIMRQNSRKIFFRRNNSAGDDPSNTGDHSAIPFISSIANSVIARCSRIVSVSTEKLQENFENELPDLVNQPFDYARRFLEYCSYKAIHAVTKRSDYLADKEFRRLMFDMMLAWEDPASENESESSPKENSSPKYKEDDDDEEEDGSLFYTNSTNMAVQVDDKKTVGLEAFARLAPACPILADPITVYNLFDVLTSSSSGQLHFLIFEKYMKSLDKVLKSAKSMIGTSFASGLKLSDGEIILDVDGVIPTQPVIQHIGISAWPGRLTLTNRALYFQSLGVGLYNKPAKYDLATDLRQVIKRELTGPLGARLFDKAVMYKAISLAEPIYLEFPEFKGHSRRDYWLAIIREVMNMHNFIRKFNLEGIQQDEALSLAGLGIYRYRAVKEAFYVKPSNFKSLLAFNLAEKVPKGDNILVALNNHLSLLDFSSQCNDVGSSSRGSSLDGPGPVSFCTLATLGLVVLKNGYTYRERWVFFNGVYAEVTRSLELAVKESLGCSGVVEEARATVHQVKAEGMDCNLAVMKELLLPFQEIGKKLYLLAAWEDPFESSVFLVFFLYIVYRGWLKYMCSCILILFSVLLRWNKSRGKPLETLQITAPPSKNPVEQLLTLQEVISQLEAFIQSGNVVLLKLRSLLFSATPQATGQVSLILIAAAAIFSFVPFRHLLLFMLVEFYTRKMPLRKERTLRFRRRMREWWVRIPAAPVQFIRPVDSKKRK